MIMLFFYRLILMKFSSTSNSFSSHNRVRQISIRCNSTNARLSFSKQFHRFLSFSLPAMLPAFVRNDYYIILYYSYRMAIVQYGNVFHINTERNICEYVRLWINQRNLITTSLFMHCDEPCIYLLRHNKSCIAWDGTPYFH